MAVFSLNEQQLEILAERKLKSNVKLIEKVIRNQSFEQLNEKDMRYFLLVADALYRQGMAIISDQDYDTKERWFNENYPHSLATAAVQSDLKESVGKTVRLPQKMLSTDKAYSKDEIEKWLERILKAASSLQLDHQQIQIRVTPKLDGYAAFDDGTILYTRGDGVSGQDITRAFERGLQVAQQGARGLGAGEIVIEKNYFAEKLSQDFENSRNIQAAIIAEKKVEPKIQQAIDEGACVFYPFALIENWTGHYQTLLDDFEAIVEQIWHSVSYDIDGVILEAIDPQIKESMGATRKFHRWQIAFKVNEAAAQIEVVRVIPQTSRTGRVSPVAELVPTKISGATISRATVHHYRMVQTNGVGPGALLEIVRSGLVIPKIERVVKAVEPQIPEHCPSCQSHLIWEADHLLCPNKSDCPAQTDNTLIHFFKTLGNNDGFGPKVIEKLTSNQIKHIHQVYALSVAEFASFGFGEKTSQNLFNQLQQSRDLEIEDWRFLSAFGVSRLAGGSCERLLKHFALVDIFDLTVEQIANIDGFAQITAEAIVEGLANIKEEFFKLYGLGFTLAITIKGSERLTAALDAGSAIAGKTLVFTGTMLQGSRGDMEKQAKALGASVAKSVTGKTDYLIAGAKVGETKINAARDKGVQELTEQEYLDLIAQ